MNEHQPVTHISFKFFCYVHNDKLVLVAGEFITRKLSLDYGPGQFAITPI